MPSSAKASPHSHSEATRFCLRRKCAIGCCRVSPMPPTSHRSWQATTSSGSLKFLIDNVHVDVAGWACETSCFSNNPQPDLQAGLGELEIKTETLRYIVCAGNDLLADASFNIKRWVLQKVSDAFRRKISE